MIQDGDAVGWFEAIFGGFGLVVSATALVPGHDYLELRADGFEVRSLLRAGFVNWAEVAEFRIFSVFGIGCMSFVSMVFMESYIRKSFIRRLHRAVFSLDDGLPDTYGMKAEQLADLLRMWRDYHLSRRVRQSGKEGAC